VESNIKDTNVRELILRFGWNSTCYQLLNPGFDYWIGTSGDSTAAYVPFAGTRVVAGSPVAPLEKLTEAVDEFEADSFSHRLRVCYFASEAQLESVIAARKGYSIIQLGAQPVWNPKALVVTMSTKASLRAQLNRAFHKGIIVQEWSAEKAHRNNELEALLHHWLATRGLPSLHFLVEPETLSNLEDRRIFVAMLNGKAVGFLNASPIPLRNGWLIEQFVRGPNAPNGTVETMLQRAAEVFAEERFDYMTLGLSPLTRNGTVPLPEAPLFIRSLLWLARAHGKRFYNFEGLEFFKTISREPHFSIRSLYAIAGAFTQGRPFRTGLHGVGRAIRQEIKTLFSSAHFFE
jgi:phosphatidylglycerol lysyltransferase